MKAVIGVCLGASTVSFVKIEMGKNGQINIKDNLSLAHNGNPKEILIAQLKSFNSNNIPVVVTGRKFRELVKLSTISEPEATELAFSYVCKSGEEYSAIASLGGETFLVYSLDEEGKIANVYTKNQCASGTGEFFLQQIKRMNLGTDEVVQAARNAEPYKVSGRCSVFCKSDCTHALNKGTALGEVASGLALMMADKVEELLKKTKHGKVLIVGGVTRNHAVMDFLKKKLDRLEIPKEATYFEALGAALYGLKNNIEAIASFDDIFIKKDSSFVFHEPLLNFIDKVKFETVGHGKARDGDVCLLGLDVGSTTTKAVIIRKTDNEILGSVYLYTLGNPIKASRQCYSELLKQIPEKINIIGLGVTGSGRHIAGLHALTEGVINEIVAHAAAAVYFDKEVDTIFEIGGQDAKYTYIINKVPADYAMNEACSAGTGSFLEEAASESLGIKVSDIEPIAMRGSHPPNFSDQCAAFISSDIKTALHENIEREDIVAGLVYSICLNYVNRVKANRPIGKKIFMQGGVCYNKAVPIAMAALTGNEIIVPPEPGLMGAFGVALEVKEKIELGLLEEKSYNLKELAERDVKYKKPFICKGGREKCDLKCNINLIEVHGKNYPFGGACDKYYSLRLTTGADFCKYDYVKKRHYLTFEKYAIPANLPQNAKTVGINQTFHTHSLYPLYYNFFTQLGLRVILSDTIEEEGLEREMTSFCFPCQLSLGLFQDLLNKKPDYYFVPEIGEMYVDEEEDKRLDFNCTCALLSSEPLYLRQAFKDYRLDGEMLNPYLNFAKGFEGEEEQFIKTAKQMNIADEEKVHQAYQYALRIQKEYMNEMFAIGSEFLEYLKRNPDEYAIVLFGRPYNTFSALANKGIPRKFASRRVHVIPFDMLDYRGEKVDENQYWEGSKKILKAAKIVKRHPQLFAAYISNYSCAPDSMTITTFRSLMGSKPSLTLELDGHTADAGINTRIDAALDIIKNYRKINRNNNIPEENEFTPATIRLEGGKSCFVSSDGDIVPLNDKRVKILIPSMGDLSAALFAASFRSYGINAIQMPEGSPEILKYARANATGKECLPLLLCAGSLIYYIENEWNGKDYIASFIIQGAGNCRVGQYPVFLREMINRKKIRNVATLALSNEDAFAGMGAHLDLRLIQVILAADVLEDIRTAIMANAAEPEKGLEIFKEEYSKLVLDAEKQPEKFFKALKKFSKAIKEKVPAKINIKDSKYIALVGEIYVRREHFSHKWLNKYFAKKGFILKEAHISEWIFYVDYLIEKGLLEPDKSRKNRRDRFIRKKYMHYAEWRIKSILSRSGYYKYSKIDIEPLLNHSKHIIPLEYKGEPGLTLGVTMHEVIEKYCGIINLGPFGCMPTRFAESVCIPETKIENKIYAKRLNNPNYSLPAIFNDKMTLPFLTIETDGNVFPQVIEARLETFTLQAERIAKLVDEMKLNGNSTFKN